MRPIVPVADEELTDFRLVGFWKRINIEVVVPLNPPQSIGLPGGVGLADNGLGGVVGGQQDAGGEICL